MITLLSTSTIGSSGTFSSDPYMAINFKDTTFEKGNAMRVHFQYAIDGEQKSNYSRFIQLRIYGAKKGDSSQNAYMTPSFIEVDSEGKLKVNGTSTEVKLDKQKWYTFDLMLYPYDSNGNSIMGYSLYLNGRRVKLAGENADGIKLATSTAITNWKYISIMRLGY